MIESSDKQIDTIIGEICGYMDMFESLIDNNKKLTSNNQVVAWLESLDMRLRDWLLTRYSSMENTRMFIFCASSLRMLEFIKRLGIIEHFIDSFQAAILDLVMLSNMDERTKNLIQRVYFRRII
jgi:hypothetical protein